MFLFGSSITDTDVTQKGKYKFTFSPARVGEFEYNFLKTGFLLLKGSDFQIIVPTSWNEFVCGGVWKLRAGYVWRVTVNLTSEFTRIPGLVLKQRRREIGSTSTCFDDASTCLWFAICLLSWIYYIQQTRDKDQIHTSNTDHIWNTNHYLIIIHDAAISQIKSQQSLHNQRKETIIEP